MTATGDRARQIALMYHDAFARRDIARALGHIADDVVCDTPAGRIQGVVAFADFLGASFRQLERTEVVAAVGDDTTAVLIHHDQTMPVPSAWAATHLAVDDGRITHLRLSRPGQVARPRSAAVRP